MHHQSASGAMMSSIVGIGVAEVEGEMKATVGIHHARWHEIKPLDRLTIALFLFWPKCTGHRGDFVASKDDIALFAFDPQLSLSLLLENSSSVRFSEFGGLIIEFSSLEKPLRTNENLYNLTLVFTAFGSPQFRCIM